MTFKAVIGAVLVASLIALSATADSGVPGWLMAGSKPTEYEMGIAADGGQNRGPAAFLKAKQSSKRVRLSAAVRSEDVNGWAGLWMRVDGETRQALAFDNMQTRPIKGNTGWQRYDVVLDVPSEAKSIALGVLLNNSGAAWLDDVKFEVVPTSVPLTSKTSSDNLPRGPQNLGFTSR